ncbi:MAG: ERAD-associated protein [Vezdaea aestivalis]|nr:MAG: ERAD-associated protein [Vezdaea aestivalis]
MTITDANNRASGAMDQLGKERKAHEEETGPAYQRANRPGVAVGTGARQSGQAEDKGERSNWECESERCTLSIQVARNTQEEKTGMQRRAGIEDNWIQTNKGIKITTYWIENKRKSLLSPKKDFLSRDSLSFVYKPVFVSLLLSIVNADIHDQQHPVVDAARSTLDTASRDNVKEDDSAQAPAFEHQSKVEEALTILRRLKVPRRSSGAGPDRSASSIGTISYYAKQTFILLFMNAAGNEESAAPPVHRKSHIRLMQAKKLLESAASEQNPDAIFLLAEMNFFGNFSNPRNYSAAFDRYMDLATLNGNSSAQHMVGFIHATGIGGAVVRDQSKSMLYHTFAALGGDTRSEMTVAYRHHMAISAPRNCDEAAFYYKRAADKAIEYWRSGPPGGRYIIRHAYHLADEEGGVYGEGASVSSAGVNAVKQNPSSDAQASIDDVIEYLDLMARKGDLKATFSLARLFYEGSRILKQDIPLAKRHFVAIARKYWFKDGRTDPNASEFTSKIAGKAAGYLGRILLRGESQEQSFGKAATWFRRGISTGDAVSQHGMGLLYLDGLGMAQDPLKAADYFKAAADQDHASAQVSLGKLFLDQGDAQVAIRYFELAARHGHLEAYYLLAELANQGVGRDRSCGMAVAYYKIVAERAEPIASSFIEANDAYENGDLELALVTYMMAAEQGYEVAQANVGYMLDENRARLPLDLLLPYSKKRPPLLRNAALALIYWTRSARQSNLDSLVKMGDHYLAGLGTDADSEKAAVCYNAAAEFLQSAQALWNLGWMHENGIGVEQDFHLAKRFYDQALETNQEAYLPVSLALLKLRARSYWNTLTNGRANSIRDEPETKKEWSFSEWIDNFLDGERTQRYLEAGADDDEDHHPFGPPPSDELLDEIDDSLLESLFIIALAGVLAFLIYYRQQRQLRRQRGGAGAPGAGGNVAAPPQQDRGLFPAPNDPGFNQWVAGGVGH